MTITPDQARPVPSPTTLTRPFWEACREHRLIVQRCTVCGTHVFNPQQFCTQCQSLELDWVASAGLGVIVTYSIVERPQSPAFEAPYVVAVVRLDERYEMMTNIVGSSPDEISIDARVRVSFVQLTESITLPCFELEEAR
ncbi:MAG: hypothetical protein JWM34_3245 [Ilumatobacteraceae bacterium]|nr:hypothetical protein [Ilumatobacteraceae bacterium]